MVDFAKRARLAGQLGSKAWTGPKAIMTFTGIFSFEASGDAARAAELRRVKALATLVLAGTLALFVTAKTLLHLHPAFGFVAAFAEAATIGGLADWYAVVALFRRPLGLPVPHTAIIQSNQYRIADKLGEFIEVHFLDAAPVEAKLRQVDFASFIADWLGDEKRGADLARFILRLLPEALAASETSGLNSFIGRRILTQIQSIDLAPLAAGTLRTFVSEGRHRGFLDELLLAVHETLNKPETMEAVRQKIRSELPTLLKLYRADAYLMKKIAASATAFLDDIVATTVMPLRMLRHSRSVLVSRHIDCGDEAVATSGDVDDEPMPVPAVTQRATQRRHMDREVGRLDKDIGPDPSHQVLLADQLTAAFKQGDQDLQRATSEAHGLVAFQQKKLRRKQAKRSEGNIGWGGAGRSGSFQQEWSGRIRALNGASGVKPRFGMKFLQAFESCSRC
jgi:hypothetical protein